MHNEIKRGRAQLHDIGPAGGTYEVDYMVHTRIRTTKNIGAPSLVQTMTTATINSVNGYILKNGRYRLEVDDVTLYQMEKAGAQWRVISE